MGSYVASLGREGLGTAIEIRDRPQENSRGGPWMSRLGDGRTDTYRHHPTEGTSVFPLILMRLTLLYSAGCVEHIRILNVLGYLDVFPIEYHFALSAIRLAAVLFSDFIFMCVFHQASKVIIRAAWSA